MEIFSSAFSATSTFYALKEESSSVIHFDRSTLNSSKFHIGVWYSGGKYRAPTTSRNPDKEREEWKKDLQNIKSLGFSSVKTWVDWSSVERVEGIYDLKGLQIFLDLAAEIGLEVVIQIYADAAPDWVPIRYPHSEFVTSNYVSIHSQSAPGPCQDNEGPRAAVGKFYQQVAALGSSSSVVYAYDVWSEPTLVNWIWFNDLTGVQFCYCEASLQRFRQWLQIKYGSLDSLNLAWYRSFQNWSEVEPPRFGTILSYSDFMDWQNFTSMKLAQDLQFYAQQIRVKDPKRIITSHSASPSVENNPLDDYSLPDDWRMAKMVDIYGSSIYPKHALATLGGISPMGLAYIFDGINSANQLKGWFVGELQAGQGNTGLRLNVPVTSSDFETWLWQLVSHGAKGIWFFSYYVMNQGYEANGYGMTLLDGTQTDRAKIGGKVASIITSNGPLIAESQVLLPKVAILYNRISYLSGGNTIGSGSSIRQSMQGVHGSLFLKNIPCAFINSDDLSFSNPIPYEVLYLPFPVILTDQMVQVLIFFVQQGGKIISEARAAWTNEKGFTNSPIPGAGLSSLFGVTELSLDPVDFSPINYVFAPSVPYGLANLIAPASLFATSLQLIGNISTSLASFSHNQLPAVVESRYGKGKTIYIGSFLGVAAQSSITKEADGINDSIKVIQNLILNWAGIVPPASVSYQNQEMNDLVEIKFLQHPSRGRILIAINRSSVQNKINLEVFNYVTKNITDLIQSNNVIPFQISGGNTLLKLDFSSQKVCALLLS